MSQWEDRFANHQATQLIRQLRDLVPQFPNPSDADGLETQERTRIVIDGLNRVVDSTDPALVTDAALAKLAGPLANAYGYLVQYTSARERTHLTNATAHLDAALDALSSWPTARLQARATAFRDAVTTYREASEGLVRSLSTDVAEAQERVGALDAELEAMTVKRATADAEAAERFAEVTASIDAQKARLDTAIAQFQEQFSAAEARRAESATATAKEQASAHADLEQAIRDDSAKVFDELQAAAGEVMRRLGQEEDRARTVVDSVGAIAFAGGYGSYADQQRRQGDFWRWVAVAALVGLVGFVIYYILSSRGSVLTWEAITERLLVVVPLAALSAYAGAQSGRHRRTEREARKLELELAAIDPYLSLFPESERNAIKAELAKRLFGQPLEPHLDDQAGAGQLIEILKNVTRK